LNMRPATHRSYAGSRTACVPIRGKPAGLTLSLGHVPGPRRRAVQVFSDACRRFFASAEGRNFIVATLG